MNSNVALLKENEIILEALIEMKSVQPVGDRARYVDTVLEATLDTGSKSQLVMKLYKDIMEHSTMDFGKIPASKGDVTRYYYYPQMADSMDILNRLGSGMKPDTNLQLMNRLHDLILTLRGDFEFGFKVDNEFIQLSYNLLVMGLYEMINVCICDYTDYLKNVLDGQSGSTSPRAVKSRMISSYIKQFITCYDKGDWAKIMHQFRSDVSNFLGADSLQGLTQLPIVRGAGVVLGSLLGLLILIRAITYIFYSTKQKLSDYARMQAELVKANMAIERDNNMSAREKQQKMYDALSHWATTLDSRMEKTERDTKKNIVDENKSTYTITELSAPINGFELA